ncbi:hypothetical protein [Roseibium sp. Sym1]|uniref:hypothetical protein n=1 Tax=Roseibium sp. Sym1 TaxID=3016006 RepID=UPI0022B452E7|nr:hypothetical protein [Roseibium sp. Sym1]
MNATLATLTAWLVYRFLTAWKQADHHWQAALLVSVVVSFYPASFIYTTSAQAEVLFSSAMAGLLLANFRLATANGQGWGPLVVSAALSGALAFMHLRGAPTAILSALFATYLLYRVRRPGALGVWLAVSSGVLGIGWWLTQLIQTRLTLESYSDISRYSERSYKLSSKFQVFSSPEEFLAAFGRLFLTGTGQLSYLVAATFGLAVVGVLVMARRAWSGSRGPTQAFCIFALVVLAANIGMSAVSLYQGTRIDHVIYGRYSEAVIPVFLAIGLLEFNRSGARIALTAFAVSLGSLVLILTWLPEWSFAPANLHNVMSLYWWMEPFTGGYDHVLLLKAGFVAAVIFLLAYRRTWGLLLVAALFALQSLYVAAYFLMPSSDGRDSQRRIAEYIQANLEPGTCVTQHLTPETSIWAHWNTKFFLFNYQMRDEAEIQPERMCSEWVISADPGFGTTYPDAVLLLHEQSHSQQLWYMGQDTASLRFPNELSTGTHIDFAGNAKGADLLGPGWGAIETWGVWMIGPRSSIDLRIPRNSQGECRFRLRGEWFLNEQHAQARVSVKLGPGPVQSFEGKLPNNRFEWLLSIRSDEVEDRRVVIDINAENPQSMQELGLSSDTRRLSIGLTDLSFEGCGS